VWVKLQGPFVLQPLMAGALRVPGHRLRLITPPNIRREEARRNGKLYGIGFAAGVEPSGSNIAYVSLAQTAQDRARADRKSGANASATISIDPSGQVTVRLCSTSRAIQISASLCLIAR
jgi:CO/xanthine dehydrogenase Mo-binding subunit